MRKLIHTYCTTFFLSILFVACHSGSDSVKANPRMQLLPMDMSDIKITYSDTNSTEWRNIAARLDSFYRIQTRAGFNGSVLIGYKGKILYERFYGYANRNEGISLGK